MSMEFPAVTDLTVALQVLPEILGENLQVKGQWNAGHTKFVKKS